MPSPKILPPNPDAIKQPAISPHAPPPSPSNLFDTLPLWLADPVLAYSSWLAGKRLRESTKRVYLAMFGRFCQWLQTQGLRLDQITANDIGTFLDADNPNLPQTRAARRNRGRQRQQYVRQLEQVFIHLGSLGFSGTNPGRQAGRARLGAGQDNTTRFLYPEQTQSVIRYIQTSLDEYRQGKTGADEWTNLRDLALVSIMLGGGLKVGHVGRLSLNCIDMTEGTVDLSLTGYAHRARLLDFALPALRTWLYVQAQRHARSLPGEWKVFEADRSSGFGRHSGQTMLSASSIHRRVRQILALSGIAGERACAQTLRNTYAGLLIDEGASDAHLVDCLGLASTRTARRLRDAYSIHRQRPTP